MRDARDETMTSEELRALLVHEIEEDPEADPIPSPAGTVGMFDVAFSRDVTFHVEPRTADELRAIVHVGPSLVPDEATELAWTRRIADVLARLDPHVLLTLRAVLVVATARDCEILGDRIEADMEYFPESVVVEDDGGRDILNPGLVGVHWFHESAVLVNVATIRKLSRELYPDAEYEYVREVEAGFWTTLVHEIRHQQVDGCPYELPWLEDWMTEEDAVETWARETVKELGL